MIAITVNGLAEQVEDNTTVAELVASKGFKPQGAVVELNGTILPRANWTSHHIKAHDMLEIVTFVGGG